MRFTFVWRCFSDAALDSLLILYFWLNLTAGAEYCNFCLMLREAADSKLN